MTIKYRNIETTIALFILLQGCSTLLSEPSAIMSINSTISEYKNTPSNSFLFQSTNTLAARHTSLPTIDSSIIPQEFLTEGKYSNITPSEAIYLLTVLQQSARTRDPYLLLEFFHFPIHQTQRCPGDIITTPNNFIFRFAELMNETTRTNILNLRVNDIWLGMDGMALAVNSAYDIWFIPIRDPIRSNSRRIIITSFLGFVTYWDYWERNGNIEKPRPTIDPLLVKFGEYNATPYYLSMDGYHKLDETQLNWLLFKILITNQYISMGPYPNDKSYSCSYEEMEICPIIDKDYVIGEYSIGRIKFICSESPHLYDVYLLEYNQLSINIGPERDLQYLLLERSKDS